MGLGKACVLVAFALLFGFLGMILGALMGVIVAAVLSVTPLGPIVENGLVAILGESARGQLINIGAAVGFVAAFFERVIKMEMNKTVMK